jgi:cyclase
VENVFVPITVGGGIKSRADVKRLLDAGADKVAINTAAIRDPSLIRECADHYGSQAIVVLHRSQAQHRWEAGSATPTTAARKGVKMSLLWVEEAVSLGAGEILLTSIDQEGTRKGFDLILFAPSMCAIVLYLLLYAAGWARCLTRAGNRCWRGCDCVRFGPALRKVTIGEIRNGLAQRKLQAAA